MKITGTVERENLDSPIQESVVAHRVAIVATDDRRADRIWGDFLTHHRVYDPAAPVPDGRLVLQPEFVMFG
ncbi:hypothetical protein GCM10009789_65670 [Kribbella sancticallisti]|uniref:Uncharacterized protein n=1 Tax=Kribbella sancticallisti TaxID=460087 RepID=A0ABP4Q6M7_9ACTN